MVEEGEVQEARGLRGGELAPRSSPTPSPKVFLSLSRQPRCKPPYMVLSQGQAAIDARPFIAFMREQMSKRRDQGQATRVSVMPQAVLPGRACQQLDVRRREPLQGLNADGRIPGATLLPEVRLDSRVSLATIHAQMAMGKAQRRQAQQPPSSQQVGPVSSQQVGPAQPTEAQLATEARADQAEDDRPPAETRVHVVEDDGGAVGAGRRRSYQEARGSMDSRARHARHSNYDWEEGLLGDGGNRKRYGMCSDPAALQAACEATLAAIPEVTSPEAKKLAKAGGYAIDNPLKLAALLHTAVVKLVQVLPVKSVIRAAGIKVDDLAKVDAGRVLGYILRRVQTRWRYSTVNNARHGCMRLELWLRDEGIQHEEGNIDNMTLNEYFLQCHRQSVESSNKEWATKLGRWSAAADKAVTAGTKEPPKPVRKRFGNKGALGHYDALHFLGVNFEMQTPRASRVRGTPPETASSASPPAAAEVHRPDRAVRDGPDYTNTPIVPCNRGWYLLRVRNECRESWTVWRPAVPRRMGRVT